ncbi:MAG: hypothetical protein H6702_06460 [Myxococcales bacterium]|nr:hypothetical protein [Myxococcales bacterium]
MRRRAALGPLALLALLVGCDQPAELRDAANAAAAKVRLTDTLTVTVGGGAVVSTTPASGDAPAQVRIRAQSQDVRVDVVDRGCAPVTVAVTVTHLPTGIEGSWRALLDGLPLETVAARAAGGGVVDFQGDPHDRDRVPLGRERPFTPAEGSAPDVRRFWVTTDRGRQAVAADEAPPVARPALAGACVTPDAPEAGRLGAAPLVARFRLRRPPRSGGFRFAVWGNTAGMTAARDALIASVNAAAVDFAVITGDLTASGRPDDLRAAVAQLDAGLAVPWYATVGDRDVVSQAVGTVVAELGRTTFAFDVGDLRLIVLDSADKALSPDGHTQLRAWLSDGPLWWGGTPAPPVRLVLTHVPPFDPFGTRANGFNQRLEAGRFIAALKRAQVPYLLTSQLAVFETQRQAGVTVVHAGGGGAPMERDAAHHWLQVDVAEGCLAADDPPAADAPCGGCQAGQACTAEGCAPCVTLTKVEFSP